MRSGFLMIALAACSPAGSGGPAWPRARPHEVDGGESLAPRAAARTIAAVAVDDDRTGADKPAMVSAGSAAGVSERTTATAPAAATPDEPITAEDIVIEIDD